MLSPASVSRTSSNTPRSLFSEPSARVAGVIRPTVTKLKRPPGSHRPMPIPDMMNAQLLGQLQQYSASALGSNDPRLDLSAALLLGVLDPATATTPSSATSAAFQMAPTTTNPMLSEFTDLDALTADLLAGTDLSVSAGIDRFDSFGSGMAASVVVVDGDEDDYSSSIAPSQFVQQAEADPIVPLSALPDPIGFDIEDLGNSRFVDQLVFGAAGGGVGGMDADADLDAGSRGDPRSEPRGSVAAIPASERKRSTSRKLGAREQPRIATGLGFGCPGRHGPGEVCESCPFSVGERYYLVAAGDTWSCAAISDPWDGLQQLLKIKRDAGLLVPHRPAEGYARLLRWLDASHWTEPGKARLRTAIEELWNLLEEDNRQTQNSNSSAAAKEDQLLHSAEYFERLCLLADRMFAGSGVPSAMWRRTGELARCNTEFAALVGLPAEDLLGKTAYAIYELMDEASAGSFFEALARLAPDAGQKAILLPTTLNNRYNNKAQPSPISCSASFTIHREPWSGVPCAVIGNFLPMAPPDPAEMVRAKMAAFGLRNAPADTDGGAEDEVRRLLGKGRLKRGLSGMLGRTTTPPTPVGLAFGAGTEGGGDFVDGMVL